MNSHEEDFISENISPTSALANRNHQMTSRNSGRKSEETKRNSGRYEHMSLDNNKVTPKSP